jgi:hypothetical protein
VPSGSAFCGNCGGPVAVKPDTADARPTTDVRSLLARANLLRVRGQWEAAAEQCAEVLRLEPRSAAAHSLLGEIYDNQGYLDRAIRWYEEALELNPTGVADRAKLARARELQQARRKAPSLRDRFSWLRVAGLAGTIICGGIILLAVIYAGEEKASMMASAPATVVARRPAGGRSAPPRWLTSQERDVGGRVALGVPAALELQSFQIDPRDQTVRIGLAIDLDAYRSGQGHTSTRERLMLDVYRVAHRVGQEAPDTRRVELTVAGRTRDAAGNLEYVYIFAGLLLTEALIVEPDVVTMNDLLRVCRGVWWNPRIAL